MKTGRPTPPYTIHPLWKVCQFWEKTGLLVKSSSFGKREIVSDGYRGISGQARSRLRHAISLSYGLNMD